ncbi:transcription factor IIIB 60 kDa subunit-like [Nymphaea colorata]|nr:transcription factor IIIB 60 kDa subunit-like [Nymphaea colorata]
MWCKHCGRDQPGYTDEINGYTCCTGCGKVIDQDLFSSEVTFLKTSSGQSRVAGSFVKSVRDSGSSESHERTLAKGRNEISDIVSGLEMSGGDSLIDQAHRLYTIAVERNFTRGRRTNQVAASCIYIICRLEKKPYLLIDFSEFLQINVYVLGAVFLQLCQLLRLVQHPIVQKPVDPSLFMPRYASMLVTSKEMERKDMHTLCREISVTAVRIIASMKRDWIQTGRKPNGLCGAALYISALSCGISCSKSDVVNIVHVCDATLTKRLIEFENTESGSLTIDTFIEKAKEFEADVSRVTANVGLGTQGSSEVLCEHKDRGATNFLHGLCRKCYDDFVEISGGIQGGSDPPAFQRAERERTLKASIDENNEGQSSQTVGDKPNMPHKDGKGSCSQAGSEFSASERMASSNSESADHVHVTEDPTSSKKNLDGGEDGGDKENLMNKRSPENVAVDGNSPVKERQHEDVGNLEDDEAETLSDIDDAEVDGYLHDEEETRLKTIIWTEMNKEYLEEQAAKAAAIAAAQAAYEANLSNCADMPGAFEVAAMAAAAVAKFKKERQQKRAEEAKNNTPAQTAAEATRRMLTKKRLSSRINYDVLEKLFDDTDKEQLHKNMDTTAKGDVKKQKIESAEIDGFSQPLDDVDDQAFKSDVFDGDGADIGGEYGEYDTYSYHGNQSYGYSYDDQYGYDDY